MENPGAYGNREASGTQGQNGAVFGHAVRDAPCLKEKDHESTTAKTLFWKFLICLRDR
jgi:hypothetical protein